MNKPIIKSLRWILVIPGAVLAFIISALFFRIIIGISTFIFPESHIIDIIFHDILQNGIAGYYCVVLGTIIAPSYKKVTALILLILISMVMALSLFAANFITKEYVTNLLIISTIVGGIFGYYNVITNIDADDSIGNF